MGFRKLLSIILCTLSVAASLTACSIGGKSDEAVFNLKELPDIGEYQSDEIKTYYHKGPVGEFDVSDDYGDIVPYISEVRSFSSAESSSKNASYGFATTDGRIIVGGIYSSVEILESRNGKTVYVAERFIKSTEDISDLSESDVKTAVDVIATDGSWMISADRVITAYPDDNKRDYIQAYDGDNMILYDFTGKNIFNESEALPDEHLLEVYYAKDRKIILEATDSDGDVNLKCVNSKGELLTEIDIGDYGIMEMVGGVFLLMKIDDKELFNLCDLNGNLLLEKECEYVSTDNERKMFIFFNGNKKDIYIYSAEDGEVSEHRLNCKGSDIQSVLFGDDGTGILYKSGKKYIIYNVETKTETTLDIGDLIDGDDAIKYESVSTENGLDIFLMLSRNDGTVDMYNSVGTYITSFSDYATALSRSPDGGYCYKSDDNRFIVRSRSPLNDFEIDFGFKDKTDFSLNTFDEKYISFLCVDESGESSYYRVYDAETKELAFDKLTMFETFTVSGKTYYCVAYDESAMLIDSSSSKLISLSENGIF